MSDISDIDIIHTTTPEWAEPPSSDESEPDHEGVNIWKGIVDECEKDRGELDEYLKRRDEAEGQIGVEQLPLIAALNAALLPILRQAMVALLETVREESSCYRPKSALNGIDFISEYLYNMNHRYPERRQSWTYIFDMKWVKDRLDAHPRPFYPFSLIWSRAYAALKIQAFMRGYWVRRRTDVQEVRTFWKDYKATKRREEQMTVI
ncbi:uncharacterized protein LOC109541704 [Dendroctonus ponderosae]